jgi:phospholipase C
VIKNTGKAGSLKVIIKEDTYHTKADTLDLRPLAVTRHRVTAADSHGWYNVSVTVTGFELFLRQFAGHVETGSISSSDPAMAGLNKA